MRLPTDYGDFQAVAYRETLTGKQHVALVKGDVDGQEDVLVRVHSECLTGDVFHSQRCDCGEQLEQALARIEQEGRGVLLYLAQEGRGIGLLNKLRAYELQEQGLDTVEANLQLGFKADSREYGIGIADPRRPRADDDPRPDEQPEEDLTGINGFGLTVVSQEPIEVEPNDENRGYLETKRDEAGAHASADDCTTRTSGTAAMISERRWDDGMDDLDRRDDDERAWARTRRADELERASENVLEGWPSPSPTIRRTSPSPTSARARATSADVRRRRAGRARRRRSRAGARRDAAGEPSPVETSAEHAPGVLVDPAGLSRARRGAARRAACRRDRRQPLQRRGHGHGCSTPRSPSSRRAASSAARSPSCPCPGAFELPLAAMALAKTRRFACIVALGLRDPRRHAALRLRRGRGGVRASSSPRSRPACRSRSASSRSTGPTRPSRGSTKGAEAVRYGARDGRPVREPPRGGRAVATGSGQVEGKLRPYGVFHAYAAGLPSAAGGRLCRPGGKRA